MGTKKRKRGERYPVEYVASELGVDRKNLIRRLEENCTDTSRGITFREAFVAFSGKLQDDALRRRKLEAETDVLEMERHEKLGNLCSTADLQFAVSDFMIRSRKALYAAFPEDVAFKACTLLSKQRASCDSLQQLKAVCPRCNIPILFDSEPEYEKKSTIKKK